MRGRREEELVVQPAARNGLGAAIRAWRRFRGMSVTDLAVRAGFGHNGRGYISRIEHSQIRHLGEERLERIAAALQLQRADLLLHRLPEAHAHAPVQDLDEAIIGGWALLNTCMEKSFDWARMQLLLTKLYCERAAAAYTTVARHAALAEAQSCLKGALLVFTLEKTPQSFREVTQLRREIGDILEASLVHGSKALLKRCSSQSLDWARIQVLLAKFYYERATAFQGSEARTALTEAQRCLKAAFPVFTRKQARRSLSEAQRLYREIEHMIGQGDTPEAPAASPEESP